MNLWTFQGTGHSLTNGRVDVRRSPYWDDPKYRHAAGKLFEKLGTDQLIWCVGEPTELFRTAEQPIRWRLDVPESMIIEVLDTDTWRELREGKFTDDADEALLWSRAFLPSVLPKAQVLVRHPVDPAMAIPG